MSPTWNSTSEVLMDQWHLSVDEVMFSGIFVQRVDTIPKGRQGVEKSRDMCDSCMPLSGQQTPGVPTTLKG